MPEILAVDIGGTNTRFGHFTCDSGSEPELRDTLWLSSRETSFSCLLTKLAQSAFSLQPLRADRIVIAVAGAIEGGRYAKVTNADWSVDLRDPALAGFADRTALINDFVAQAYGCLTSSARKDALTLQNGTADHAFPLAAIGAGTGLGMCPLVPVQEYSRRYLPVASEGGHAPVPFVTETEAEYRKFLLGKIGHAQAIGDTVLSGQGLMHLHWFLTGRKLEPAEVAAEIGPESETTAWFARFYGRVARSLALYVLPRAGMYICGGLAAKNSHLVTHPEFLREFTAASGYAELLQRIPLTLIRAQDVGLHGAAFQALALLHQESLS